MRDTYNYVTIQTDLKMPRRAAAAALDAARQARPLRLLPLAPPLCHGGWQKPYSMRQNVAIIQTDPRAALSESHESFACVW